MSNKNLDMMQKILDEKKQKSASQGLNKRAPQNLGGAQAGIKRYKKGGLFDK